MSGYCLSLSVPFEALGTFETCLDDFKGAISCGLADRRGQVLLELYLSEAPARPALAAAVAMAADIAGIEAPDWRLEALPAVDWVAESQNALPALRAGRFYLYGAHVAAPPPPALLPLQVEAGAAFGTGRHESTRGCLLALGLLARRRRVHRVLDMGCGSGVLAMAAARLWPCRVLAVDNDRRAVQVARQNARLNGVAARVRARVSDGYRWGLVERAGPFDLICANILAEPLRRMAPDLKRHLARGGHAVLAGLLADQERLVLAAHRAQGLRLVQRIRLAGWVTLVLAG